MRISQPLNCEATTKILNRLPGRFEVSVALWHVFSLGPEKSDPDDSRIIWSLAQEHRVQQLDEGYPKSRGEFLCFGLGYPPSDLQSGPFEVAVSVSQHKRMLAVFGPREFNKLGEPQETGYKPAVIAVNPYNAFGGREFLDNPDGIGWQAKAGDRTPEIEDPDQLIISAYQAAAPAGFWPLSPSSRLRKKYLGKFDDRWLASHWPSFPPDTNLEFFQTAPEKQRLPSYFKGNESCEIINMHAHKESLVFSLPKKRARCVYRRGSDAGIFHGWLETPMVAETLYLFPNEEIGALLHRAVIRVQQADALDLRDVLLELEEPDTDGSVQRMIKQHYQTQLIDVISPIQKETNTQNQDSQIPLTTMSDKPSIFKNHVVEADKRITKSGYVKLSADFEYILTQSGLKQETIKAIRHAADPFEALSQELKHQIQLARREYDQAVAQSGLSESEYLENLRKHPEVDSALKNEDFSAGLSVQIGVMGDFVDNLIDMLRSTSSQQTSESLATLSSDQTTTSPEVTEQNTAVTATDHASSEMQLFLQERQLSDTQFAGMNLSGLCFAGLSMTGMDFTGAICEETDFTNCDLSHACFKDATLTGTLFTGARMIGTDLSGVSASDALFNQADLSQASLFDATLINCEYKSVRFDQANLEQTQLDHSDLTGSSFLSTNMKKVSACETLLVDCSFVETQLDHADFMRSTFINCRFVKVVGGRVEFSGAKLQEVHFSECDLKDCSAILNASFDTCAFNHCELQSMNWITVCLSNVTFNCCVLNNSDFSSTKLTATAFVKSKAKEISFFSSHLKAVAFTQNNLMEASFQGAKLQACSLVGNNLFGADFIETQMDDATILQGNVTLKTILVQRGYPSTQ